MKDQIAKKQPRAVIKARRHLIVQMGIINGWTVDEIQEQLVNDGIACSRRTVLRDIEEITKQWREKFSQQTREDYLAVIYMRGEETYRRLNTLYSLALSQKPPDFRVAVVAMHDIIELLKWQAENYQPAPKEIAVKIEFERSDREDSSTSISEQGAGEQE